MKGLGPRASGLQVAMKVKVASSGKGQTTHRTQLSDDSGNQSCSEWQQQPYPQAWGYVPFTPPISGWGAHSRVTLLTDPEPREKE